MPPRYAYWTILIGDEPTAFRSGSQDELMPTLKRLQQRHAEARMMWWQNGKLWNSRLDAQEAMRARGEMGRAADSKQRPRRFGDGKPEWQPKDQRFAAEGREPRRSAKREGGLDWKPKGESSSDSPLPAPGSRPAKPEWKPRGSPSSQIAPGFSRGKPHGKPEWKPKGSFKPERSARPEWKPKSDVRPSDGGAQGARRSAQREGGRKPSGSSKLEWKPKSSSPQDLKPSRPEKRKWVPKAEYKQSQGIEAKKDKNWRPGGEHKDPRQKYKDAKKAKWGRFKQTVRKRWETKQGGKKKNE
jgi:hypothetical protein